MSADRSRVLKRVTEILNLCDPGTYSATLSARNKTRNATAIADFTDEAGLLILKAIAERPNEFRSPFLDVTTVTTSPTQMPVHIGPVVKVLITPYSGGTAVEGKQASYQQINSWRENPHKVYDAKNHDESGSQISGYFDVYEDRFYFTGYSATLTCVRPPARADNTTLIPEILESVWIDLAVGRAEKVGTGGYEAGLIGNYGKRGEAHLEEFKAGNRQFPEVDQTGAPMELHNVAK